MRKRKKINESVDPQTDQQADWKEIINENKNRTKVKFTFHPVALLNCLIFNFIHLYALYKHCQLLFVCMGHSPWHLTLRAHLRRHNSNLNSFILVLHMCEYNCQSIWTFSFGNIFVVHKSALTWQVLKVKYNRCGIERQLYHTPYHALTLIKWVILTVQRKYFLNIHSHEGLSQWLSMIWISKCTIRTCRTHLHRQTPNVVHTKPFLLFLEYIYMLN